MIKVLGILIFASGLYLLTLWAKENLKKKKLLVFAIGTIICSLLLICAVNLYMKYGKKIGSSIRNVDQNELIKMKELLSIE